MVICYRYVANALTVCRDSATQFALVFLWKHLVNSQGVLHNTHTSKNTFDA